MLSTILLILAGYALHVLVDFGYQNYVTYKIYKKITKTSVPGKVDQAKVCKGPHHWIKAQSVTGQKASEVNVCRVCGLISGTEKMASPEAIDKIEEQNKFREIQEREWKTFLNKEDEQLKDFLKIELAKGLDFDKITQIHAAGMNFEQRFALYLESKKEEIEKEVYRSN